jgi:hypothetical protein
MQSCAGLTNVYPQNAALSFTADHIHMSGTVPDGSASGSNIREAEKAGQRINYGEKWSQPHDAKHWIPGMLAQFVD